MAASTTLLTDAGTMITNGPSAATVTKAAGTTDEIDYVGMLQQYQNALKELKNLLTNLKNATDSGDGNLTTINNDLSTLS